MAGRSPLQGSRVIESVGAARCGRVSWSSIRRRRPISRL